MAYNSAFHDKIAQVSLDFFAGLPKSGKPTVQEWTVLSAIVKHNDSDFEVAALATGSKCIGRNSMSPRGDILNDSHAEILCRRAFLRYVYHELEKTESFTFQLLDGKFSLKEGVSFHFFTTHVPCGDASIFPSNVLEQLGPALSCTSSNQSDEKESVFLTNNHEPLVPVPCRSDESDKDMRSPLCQNESGDLQYKSDGTDDQNKCGCSDSENKLNSDCDNYQGIEPNIMNNSDDGRLARLAKTYHKSFENNDSDYNCSSLQKQDFYGEKRQVLSCNNDVKEPKRMCLAKDIHRTGAKCLPTDSLKDPREKGTNFHVLGAVRSKPGRGDRTLSLSCSDKIAKWCYLGLQGNLLTLLLHEPIYLKTFTISGGTPFDPDALNRALHIRFPEVTLQGPYNQVRMDICQVRHTFKYAKNGNKRPCPSSIIYSNVTERKVEVAVGGKKQGTTKKAGMREDSLLRVCRLELYRSFLAAAHRVSFQDCAQLNSNYRSTKLLGAEYTANWRNVRTNCFKVWTEKDPALSSFSDT